MKTALVICLLCVGVACAERPTRCKLPPIVGPCRAHIPRFYFNTYKNSCELFFYGGCRGNDNRFVTLEQCEALCADRPVRRPRHLEDGTSTYSYDDVEATAEPSLLKKHYKGVNFEKGCRPTPRTGNCFARFIRWYFNIKTGRCETFIYGGCGGNKNNYKTLADCELACLRK